MTKSYNNGVTSLLLFNFELALDLACPSENFSKVGESFQNLKLSQPWKSIIILAYGWIRFKIKLIRVNLNLV